MARVCGVFAVVLLALGACGPGSSATGGAGTSGGAGAATSGGNSNAGAGAAASGAGDADSVGGFHTHNLELGADGSVALGPGFLPTPVVLNGSNGGPTDAYTLGSTTGASCVGYLPVAPQHVVEITAPIPYLRIVVDTYMAAETSGGYGGSIDSTLFVRLPGGAVWCDDDSDGDLQPVVAGPVLPGRLEIFVGAYSASGTGARYKLAITENASYTHSDLR